jgi:protein-disulfide isomerase
MRAFVTRIAIVLGVSAALLLVAQTRPGAGVAKKKAATATAAVKPKSALDKSALEAYVRHLFLWGTPVKIEVRDPKPAPFPGFLEILVHASAGELAQDEVFYVSKDGQKIVRGQVFDIKDTPFRQDLDKLKTEFQPSLGTAGAPVVLVMFSDFQCPFCREEAKLIRQNLISAYPKEVRLYFKDFPLKQIHPWAKTASIAGRCIFRQNPGAFWNYYDWIFEHQSEITPENVKAKLVQYAASQGSQIDALQFGRCLDTRATVAEVDKNVAEAKLLQIASIPTLFVNGRRLIGNQGWSLIRQAIDYEIDYQKTAKNAGEQACCELKIPSPMNR